jgi:predicted ribosome quality control (RQC) complex YloA/Tae2 family protein
MSKVIKTNLERCEKKLALQTREIQEAEKADTYRLYGELLTANLHALPSGTKEVSVFNYYDPDGANLIIPMDPQKTPGQNAQHYFKLYTKAKTALEKQKKLQQENLEEIQYLESLSDHLSRAAEELEIMEIRQELIKGGYMKGAPQKGRGKAKQPPASKPHRYLSSDGYEIYVGRNNLQNDELTLRFASGNDLWLHTKVIPGSHVIVKSHGREFPPATLLEAAKLAAYYSQARMSENVPVDYCPRRNVKKPSGAKPGMVIYDHYNTVYVTPSEAEIEKLKGN